MPAVNAEWPEDPKARMRAMAEADPEGFRKLMATLAEKVVVPHSGGQQEIMDSDARFQIVCCGRRFGKSVCAAKKALKKCRTHKQIVWWVAPTYKNVKIGYEEVLRQLPEGALSHPPQQASAFDAGRSIILRFKNGSRMQFHSAERPDGMLGASVDYVVIDEAAKIKKSVWEQTIRATLMDRRGSALLISTPVGRNYFYYLWLRGQDPNEPDYASWQFPTSANPHLAEGEVEEFERTMPLVIFQQEILAQFVSSAGSVFRFNHDIVVPRVRPSGHVVVGVDLARSIDFTVFEAANAETNLPCAFDRFTDVSWPMQRNRLKGFCRRLRRDGATHVTLVMDSTGVGDPIVEDMEADGYDVVPINFTKTKAHMVIQLAKDLEDGYVRIGADYVHELENYSYAVTDTGKMTYGAPEGQHDDVVSATMLRHWGVVQEGAPNITAISAGDAPDAQGPEDREPDVDDWSDLLDGDSGADTGLPTVAYVEADAAADIMARPGAWR